MKFENFKENVKNICRKIGKRNFIIAGAVLLIAAAVVINVILFAGAKDEFPHDTDAGLKQTTTATPASVSDTYFATVMLDRQRVRDEAIEVLQSVVDNEGATPEAKTNASAEISKITQIMEKEANIESLIVAKGFEKCVAVINGNEATIVVKGNRPSSRADCSDQRNCLFSGGNFADQHKIL